MASNYPTSLDAFTTGTLTGIVSGSDHGNKADAINKIEAAIGAGVTNGRRSRTLQWGGTHHRPGGCRPRRRAGR